MTAAGMNILLGVILLLLNLTAAADASSQSPPLRLGYLEHPGSALCLVAGSKGFFRAEGARVRLIRFRDTESGLAALAAGEIDAGAFAVGETLRQIAEGKELRIIAGGGTVRGANPLADLDEAATLEQESGGIVVAVAAPPRAPGKEVLVRLVTALIRAYQSLQKEPGGVGHGAVHFDPNPDYRRIERLWRFHDLQGEKRPRDFLANHVYEEIYCDALDRLIDRTGTKDGVLQKLFSEAVCVPDCCPPDTKKRDKNKGGSR